MRKFISLGTEIYFLPHGIKFSFEGREIFLRKAPRFPSARKFISLRKKKYFLAEGNFLLCARKFCALRKAKNRRSKGAEFSYVRKFISVRTEFLRLRQK